MAAKAIRSGVFLCSAALLIGTAAARAVEADPTADAQIPQAGPAPTTPKALTKPKSGSQDDFFEAIGTKKGFLLGWTNLQSSPVQITANVQRFTSDGKALGKPIKLESGFLEGIPEFVDLGGDKFGVVWKSGGGVLKGAVIDAGNGKAGKAVVVLPSGAASYIHDMAPLPKGKVALVTRRSPGFNEEDTVLVILDSKMKPVGSPKVIEDDVPGPLGASTFEQAITAYGGGAMAFFRASNAQIKGVPINAKGKPGKPFQINSTTLLPFSFAFSYVNFNVKAEPLNNGGFVVTWTMHDQGSNSNFDIRARVFDKKGKPLGPDFIVNADLVGNQIAPEILVYKNAFAVAWTDVATLGQFTQRLRFFDLGGKPISDEIVTEYFGVDGKGIGVPSNDTEYARLAKDAVVKTFTATGQVFGDGIPSPYIGGPAGETITGTSGADLIVAAGGNDTISGGAGDDLIDAGAGNDLIDGGPGANVIVPGPGDDTIIGGADAEIFVFTPSQGSDEIIGFGANDRIDVSGFHYNQKEAVRADAAQVGPDLVITLNGVSTPPEATTVVRLKNRTLADLADANIIL